MIQGCPVEVLDDILEYIAYSNPQNAQATLGSLMLTCSHFLSITKRHFNRIVCLPNAKKINAFAGYLKQVVESGDYGNRVLPIQHLAVVGEYREPSLRCYSYEEFKAETNFPFIVTTAAPSLFTLTILDVEPFYGSVNTGGRLFHGRLCVPDGTIFPMLRDLIALDRHVIHLVLQDDDGKFDKRACHLRYPVLRRLYIPGYNGSALPLALPFLDDLRLEVLDGTRFDPPTQDEVGYVHSLIIDAPQYYPEITYGDVTYHESRDEYDSKISRYQALIDEAGNPGRSGMVVPVDTHYIDPGRILSGWADAVVGGAGCWTTTWVPTIQMTSHTMVEQNI